ncbi:MAG: MBL fold metallo-hydrolase [Micrococcus sp.]|nr:MBL fold metallo-hydrolase [Micrococcus sp.]
MGYKENGAGSTTAPYVVTLGTAGGPRWWTDNQGQPRQGIATAVVVEDGWYLVDCGSGVGRQIRSAGLSMVDLKGIFITHMHSDHIVDLASLMLFAPFEIKDSQKPPIPIFGPGSRGRITPMSPRAQSTPEPVNPNDPGAGIESTFAGLVSAFSADFNDRMRDSLTPGPYDHFAPHDIEIPETVHFDPDENVAPEMDPLVVFQDEGVQVRATLVSHHPTAPAFGFRFDTPAGSVTISGDTAPCKNLIQLAQDTDLLLHEVISLETMAALYTDAAMLQATMDHHRRAHTTAEDAGRVASQANAKALALHHLVPSHAPIEVWQKAADAFDGRLLIPQDLEIISFERSEQDDTVDHSAA